MKVISLNTWDERTSLENLLTFFKKHADVDVFCLQEIWNGGEHMLDKTAGGAPLRGVSTELLKKIEAALPNHTAYFRPHFFDFYGLAIFVKNNLPVIEEGEVFVYKERGYISPEENGNHARNIQYVTIQTPSGPRTVINFHGLWNGKGKTDTEDRLLQSGNIIHFLNSLGNPFVLCGDFNLLPDTESLKKLDSLNVKNLIQDYGITSTRTSLYTKPNRFADYAFVSKELPVNDFKVLPDEVSDHNALYIDFQ